ncbi:MAG: pitrilysin family protein [Gemmatimonadaceae bacterium]
MSFARRLRWLGRAGIPTAVLFASTQLDAQVQPRRTPAAPAAAKATQITSVEGITEYSLPNGLRVLLFPDQSKPTVTVNITYLVGSRHEGVGETGMAHLLEHLVFKGSKGHPDMAAEFTKYGARRNGSTWFERTNYFETVPATDVNLAWALDLEADRMVNSFIAKKDLESEFSVVRNELESGENNPTSVLVERAMRAAFRWHGYGRSTIGTRSDIENVPIDRLQAFYRKYYQPDNAVLVVAGKFDPAKTLALIENKYGRIPRPKRTLAAGNLLYANYTVEPTQDGEQLITVRRVGDSQVLLSVFHTPAGTHPDFAAVEVLGDILGNNPSGRLYKAVIDTKLAGVVVAQPYPPQRDPAVMLMLAIVRQEQSLDSVRTAIDNAIETARTGSFTAEEVNRAKTTLTTNIQLSLNNSEAIGRSLSEWAAMGDWRMLFLHRDRIAKVTPDDVQRVAAAYLKSSNRTTALFIPTKTPDRAEIPAAPNVAAMLAGYKGGEVVQAGEAFDATPKNIDARTKRATLPNGMHLTMVPKLTRGNRVNAQILLRHGTEASLTGKGQVPAFSNQMLSRGTTALTRQQVQDSLAKLKAQVGIFGGDNSAIASIETTRPNLMAVLDLVAQQLRSPRFDPVELEALKKENLAFLEQQKSQPQFVASRALQKKLMPKPKGHPLYTSNADELIADINAVTPEALKAFHLGFYGATYADMAVVGDFDAAEVTAAATRLFGDWKNPQPFARLVRTYVRSDSSFESIETPDKANAVFSAAQNVELKDDDPDYPAAIFANFMLGGSGMSSRITARLRQKEGISYGAGAGLNVQQLDRYGTWTANAILAPQNVERLQTAFREEIDRALKDGFTAAEIEQFRGGYLQARSQGRANDNELVGILVTRRFAGRTMTYDEDLEGKVGALTPDQINAALRKYIDPKRMIIVRAGDFAKNPAPKATP